MTTWSSPVPTDDSPSVRAPLEAFFLQQPTSFPLAQSLEAGLVVPQRKVLCLGRGLTFATQFALGS
jgi:hypothetical protein